MTPDPIPDHDDPEHYDPAYERWVTDHASPDHEG